MFPRRFIFALIATTACLLAAPAAASASEHVGAGYRSSQLTFQVNGKAVDFGCGGAWSGSADGAGNTYVPCGQYVYEINIKGQYIGAIKVPDGYEAWRDVAVTWDGSTLYYTSSDAHEGMDQPNPETHPNVGLIIKMVRSSSGTWHQDTGFQSGWDQYYGQDPSVARRWSFRNVDTDHAGHLYATINDVVVVMDSHGHVLSYFGDNAKDDQNVFTGGLEMSEGLSVTSDGMHVYVVNQQDNYVERWDRGFNDWTLADWHIGDAQGRNLDQTGNTPWPTQDNFSAYVLSSPYDVALDGSGNVYVMDTTYHRVIKYRLTSTGGTYEEMVWYNDIDSTDGWLYHGFSVDYAGNVVVGGLNERFGRVAQAGALDHTCAPDDSPPSFTKLTVPASVANGKALITLAGHDSCSKVEAMQLTGDVKDSGRWLPLRSTIVANLSGSYGRHLVTISIRDHYGRVTSKTAAINWQKIVARPRRSFNLNGNAGVCKRYGGATLTGGGWHIVDRCATFTAKVVSISRSGGNRFVLVSLSPKVASKLYTGVTDSIQMWAVGTTHTHTPRKLRVGQTAQITAALAENDQHTTISAAPVWQWTRV
jgi:hypothetical protein